MDRLHHIQATSGHIGQHDRQTAWPGTLERCYVCCGTVFVVWRSLCFFERCEQSTTIWNVHGMPRQHCDVWLWLFPNRLIISSYASYDILLAFLLLFQGKTAIGRLRYDLHGILDPIRWTRWKEMRKIAFLYENALIGRETKWLFVFVSYLLLHNAYCTYCNVCNWKLWD